MGLAIGGFHRSGTSSVTQHLAQSGLNPGTNLIGANEYNRYGHFEDWPPVTFHDEVLAAAGLDWASVTYNDIPLVERDREFIRGYCAEREANAPVWGFKDPRVCQFLGHWMDVVPSLKALIVYRSPAECSWSLYRRSVREVVQGTDRNQTSARFLTEPDHALALWVTHNEKLLEVARRFPERTIVVGHASFAAGRNLASEVRDRLGLDLEPADVADTFDAKAVTRAVAPLPVMSRELTSAAGDIWDEFESLDTAGKGNFGHAAAQFSDDPTGLILTNALLTLQIGETRKLVDREFNHNKEKAAIKVARKLKRWPFSLFFSRSDKYRSLIDEILK
ncbi:hypothetical protein OEZ60_15675 [Defluviimonas sp. WL0024]|uniref:Sulfotransferase family protein n=1 Tax=Albidovulum salinarum TaxID=2984153 RepID=A0ABT2X729_9RHOB|nr:hypothetical protein [Defluviimonas sp. WL0024]MCU9849440.1 hypothetical protein [Defluviimonas sp. WL0024]